MAAPATSTRENALANVASTLAAVTAGASYNFSIDRAVRIDGPSFIWLDDNYRTLAFVEEGLSSWAALSHSGLWLVTVEVFVQVATRYEPDADGQPFEMTTDTKSTVRSKLIADTVRALMADRTRGHNAKHGFILTDDAPLLLDEIGQDGTWISSGWVAHELRFEMAIEVNQAAP